MPTILVPCESSPAYPDPDTGLVAYWPDLYGYDRIISREMKAFLPE